MLSWSAPLLAIVVALAAYQLIYIALYLANPARAGEPLFGDFFAFWSFARFAHQLPADSIYDTRALQAFQLALPVKFSGFYPYPYPPIFLLFLRPLGGLGYIPAYLTWIGVTLGAYVAAVAGRDWRSPQLWLAIVAPTTLLSIISGQNGLLTAALIIGGFRLIKRWPFWAGVVLGCLVFKPQLFALIPIVLLAGRRWRALAGLTASVLGLAALSVAAFGPMMWLNWVRAMPALLQLAENNRQNLLFLMPTVTAGLMEAGVDARIVQVAQTAVALAVVGTLVWLFHRARKTGPNDIDLAALQVGVFLVTPYAFIYDMPMVTNAAICAVEHGAPKAGPLRFLKVGAPVAAYVLPIFMLGGVQRGWPVGAAVLLALFAVIMSAALNDVRLRTGATGRSVA
jgi:Glycosyltransferase family 87